MKGCLLVLLTLMLVPIVLVGMIVWMHFASNPPVLYQRECASGFHVVTAPDGQRLCDPDVPNTYGRGTSP